MKVTIDGTTYVVTFDHGRFEKGNRERFTTCTISIEGAPSVMPNYGVATCSIRDMFCKERGRKIALARAIEGFDRETRKVFWEAYFNRLPERRDRHEARQNCPA